MSADNRIDDYWTQQSTSPEGSQEDLLCIKTIQDIEPLDAQFGVDMPKTVPDALYEALFGQPDPIQAELEQAENDPDKVPPLHTYAILDAAKVPGLPELLATSGLEHRCFFKGETYEELRNVAPWVVCLEEGNAFSRNLFTKSDAPWHVWGVERGVYIRSRQSFDRLWQHLRKFTKLQNGAKGDSFLRYWEVETLEAFGAWPEMFPAISQMLRVIFGGCNILFHAPYHDGVFHISPTHIDGQNQLSENLRGDLKRARFYGNMFTQAEDFHNSYPQEAARYGETAKALHRPLFEAVNEIYSAGLKDPQLRARFLIMAVIKYPEIWPGICNQPEWLAVRSDPTKSDERFRDLCAVLKHQSTRRSGALKVWW